MRQARLWNPIEGGKVQCFLCNHHCKIADDKVGICGVRKNIGGTLQSLVYGKVIAANIDPIEKKPLFNFLPGSRSYSFATVGCNFRCLHCQNSDISQMPKERGSIMGQEVTPEEIVNKAVRSGCRSISYTYTEPTIFYEFARDCSALAREKGLKNIFVTNGFMTQEMLRDYHPLLDAANVDIKAFNETFYTRVCGAKLQPVLDNVRLMRELGIWVEITTLIIPGMNDSEGELRQIARFIRETDPAMPWHVTAFHPTYKLTDKPRTPVSILRRAREIGLEEGLSYVYEGNVPGEGGENTFCPSCKKMLVHRIGYDTRENRIVNGMCGYCGSVIDGVF